MVFPWSCESWILKKAEHWRIDAFQLWCWRRLLRVPWTARRSNQSILKEVNPEYSLEGLILKLKLQYFGHRMPRADSLENTLMVEKIEGRRRRRQQRMRWLDGITDSMYVSLRKLGDGEGQGAWHAIVHGVTNRTWLSCWTTSECNILISVTRLQFYNSFPKAAVKLKKQERKCNIIIVWSSYMSLRLPW